jgi:hypothetical protein
MVHLQHDVVSLDRLKVTGFAVGILEVGSAPKAMMSPATSVGDLPKSQ